ncbi:MAG: adenylate/guanylate cyclase domain-containing protein, partial [Cyanobacteria bacterium J083]
MKNRSSTSFWWQWRGVLITSPVITFLLILLRLTGLLEAWELSAFDLYLRWRSAETIDQRIVIVGIDEQDVQKIGQAIIPDLYYAQLLQKLLDMQPQAIGLDVYRDQPVEPGHQALVKVFASSNKIIGIEKVIGDSQRDAVAPAPTLKAKGQIGANDTVLDLDNKVRRGLLSLTVNDQTIPSFAMYLAALYLESRQVALQTAPGTDNWWKIGKTVLVPFAPNDGGYIRADAGGYQILLNYRGSRGKFSTVSLLDVLENRVADDWGRDRIILIGYVGESFKDMLATPYSQEGKHLMPGVEIHANLTSQIISAALDQRPLLQVWSDTLEYIWIGFWATLGAILAWSLRQNQQLSLVWRGGIITITSASLLAITYLAWLFSWWLPVIPPLLAFLTSVATITAYIARSAGQIRHTFGRYLSREIVATLLESPEGLKLGGERKSITILTSDLRGFTAIAEHLSPEEVVRILNFYLGTMAEVISAYQGTIDEFMGDGILVLFGAPVAREDDAIRAMACALAMQLAMQSVNQQMQKWGLPELAMGIGINTGEVVVGNLGSEKRAKYGVVGSQVNLTYRIESYTLGGQILLSPTTYNLGKDLIVIDEKKEVTPKGLQKPITVYGLVGIKGKYN